MTNAQLTRNLAHEIGLCRIALIVDRFNERVQSHPQTEDLFAVAGNGGDHRARLTYFGWVLPGGKRLKTVEFAAIPKLIRDRIAPDKLRDWISVFRKAAVPVIGEELTRAWIQKVQRLSRRLLSENVIIWRIWRWPVRNAQAKPVRPRGRKRCRKS
jgi:truncated hemoglobin YjbI